MAKELYLRMNLGDGISLALPPDLPRILRAGLVSRRGSGWSATSARMEPLALLDGLWSVAVAQGERPHGETHDLRCTQHFADAYEQATRTQPGGPPNFGLALSYRDVPLEVDETATEPYFATRKQ